MSFRRMTRRCATNCFSLSSSFLVPCLIHDGLSVWDTLAIGEYLNEIKPEAHLLPDRPNQADALPLDLRGDAFRL